MNPQQDNHGQCRLSLQPHRVRARAAAAAALTLTALFSVSATAQESAYPARPIRIIVGFLPGSSNDTLARFVGGKLNERMGQLVVVDNRPGANGIIGSDLAAKATPDGHTLLLMSVSHAMSEIGRAHV